MIDDFEKSVTPALKALMGEWATYCHVHWHVKQHSESDVTDREYFETQEFMIGPCGPFDQNYHLFQDLGLITHTDLRHICKATCFYTDVWRKILCQPGGPKREVVWLFFDAATQWEHSQFTSSEDEPFTIDAECKPLFDQFIQEEYVTQSAEHYFWTSKLRPYLESTKVWLPAGKLSEPQIFVEAMPIAQKDALARFSFEDKISTVMRLQSQNPGMTLRRTINVIDVLQKDKIATKPNAMNHWKWYGEVPSQSNAS